MWTVLRGYGTRFVGMFSGNHPVVMNENKSGIRWFDRFIDAMNRLPRPLLTLSFFGYLAYCVFDPAGFTVRMVALESTPDGLWSMWTVVISAFMAARTLTSMRGNGRDTATPSANLDDLSGF